MSIKALGRRRLLGAAAVASAAGLIYPIKDTFAAGDEPTVKLAISSWIGYGPLVIALDKGFFKKAGVNVKLVRIEAAGDRRSALAAGAIVAMPTTVDTQVVTAAVGVPVVQVVAFDDSDGADGIVAKKDIATFEALKGRTVGLETDGGASFFWMLYLLKKHGMKLDDLKVKSMQAGAAGAAFAAGHLDAAVTWQPWLTTAEKTSFGHILLTSKATPGVIEDTLAFRRDFVAAHPEAVQGVVNGILEAMKYIKSNQHESYSIMGKFMDQTEEEFAKSAEGVQFYGLQKNLAYFGTKEKPGPLYALCEMANDLFFEAGIIKQKVPDIAKLIDPDFIQRAAKT